LIRGLAFDNERDRVDVGPAGRERLGRERLPVLGERAEALFLARTAGADGDEAAAGLKERAGVFDMPDVRAFIERRVHDDGVKPCGSKVAVLFEKIAGDDFQVGPFAASAQGVGEGWVDSMAST
jgi:hypothetical protein